MSLGHVVWQVWFFQAATVGDEMPVVGQEARPHVLFVGFGENDPGLAEMVKVAASSRIASEFELERLRLADFDAIVCLNTESPIQHSDDRLSVLSFGPKVFGTVGVAPPQTRAVRYIRSQESSIMHVSDRLSPAILELVQADLLPKLKAMPAKPYLIDTGNVPLVHDTYPGTFVSDAFSQVIAGELVRLVEGPDTGRIWMLPFYPNRPERWLRVALECWSIRLPARFPLVNAWRSDGDWQMPRERHLLSLLHKTQEEYAVTKVLFEARIEQINGEIADLASEIDNSTRRLLTAQSAALVEAVIDALKVVGFNVEDVDSGLPAGQARKEDLRLTDPLAPGWVGLVEVKGYMAGGAKSNDLTKIVRYQGLFEREMGREPSALWYIVNHSGDRSPSDRPQVLAGADEHVDYFGSLGGMILDTRELFTTVKLIEEGEIASDELRVRLRGATGIYHRSIDPSQ